MISVGSEVQVLPGPYFFWRNQKKYPPEGSEKGPARRCRAARRAARVTVGGRVLFHFRQWPVFNGGLAQLVEHLLCKQGVIGSNPLASISPEAKSPGGFAKRPAMHASRRGVEVLGWHAFRSGTLSERELVRCCLPSTDFLARALRPALGMFFQTVNRIWWIAAWLRCGGRPRGVSGG